MTSVGRADWRMLSMNSGELDELVELEQRCKVRIIIRRAQHKDQVNIRDALIFKMKRGAQFSRLMHSSSTPSVGLACSSRTPEPIYI